MIQMQKLTKRFGGKLAVDSVSLQVGPGEVLGFLGPNGAGKSTTMKMLTGYLQPTAGSISVCGHDILEDTLDAQATIGYLPEGAPLYEDMSTRSFLEFIAQVRGYRGKEKTERLSRVVDVMGLRSVLNQRIETLSKGFRRRVGLAQAILHDPRVLILDEPTDGLDPNQKHHVRDMIRGLSEDKIVIISTHILEEVTAVCSRAVIIHEGRIVADCTPAELESQSRFHGAVTLQLSGDLAPGDTAGMVEKLAGLPGVEQVEANKAETSITVFSSGGESVFRAVNTLAVSQDWKLNALYVERGRLDDVFRQITEEVNA